MNYIEQLNAFFIKKEQDALSSRAQCLYFNLLGLNNRYRWAAWFSVSGLLFAGDDGAFAQPADAGACRADAKGLSLL